MVLKTLEKISNSVYEKIMNSDFDTGFWYIEKGMEFKEIIPKERQEEIANELADAIKKKKLDYDKKTKCPVLFLDNPINSVDRLYLQNIIKTEDVYDEKGYFAYIFGCSENIISQMNETDYKIALNMVNLLFLVQKIIERWNNVINLEQQKQNAIFI